MLHWQKKDGYEQFIRNNGIYDEITECLTKAEKNIIEFSGIGENPTYEKVLEGAGVARENQVWSQIWANRSRI